MRVAYDLTATLSGSTGVARYTRQLAEELCGLDVQICPFAVGRGRHQPAFAGTHHLRVPLRVVQRSWQMFGRPRAEQLVGPVDLVHAPDLLPPPTTHPVAVTVHDTAALTHPQLHSARQHRQQVQQLKVARTAQVVIAVTEATASDLVAFGVPPERIYVTLLGVTPLPRATNPPVRGPYVLVVGELAVRKNLTLLARAFQSARLPQDVRLVLAGPDGYRASEVRENLPDSVISIGEVTDQDLSSLYAHAIALCFPSRAEGFGLPVLEAMSYGLPVIASDLAVTREVTGGAARFVNPLDGDAWRTALTEIVEDPDERARLRRLGLIRAGELTWRRTAELTLIAYGSVL